jgi:hypothetical protein
MSIKKTITSIFMVPTLDISREQLQATGFINGYVGDINRDTLYPDSIYMLFKPADVEKFREFLGGEYDRTKDIIEDYDYPGGYVVVIYKLNPKLKDDYKLITEGKYSKVSQEYKKLFPSVIPIEKGGVTVSEHSLQYRVFNKTKDLITFWETKLAVILDPGQELWEMYEKDTEFLDINNLK